MNDNLNKLSLLAFIDISNSFSGLYMTPHLRVWHVRVDVRLDPRFEFEVKDNDLDIAVSEALEKVAAYYQANNYQEFLCQ